MSPFIFQALLRTGVQGSLLALTAWTVCRFSPRLSPGVRCWIWWLVLAEFAIAPFVATPLRIHAPASAPYAGLLSPHLPADPGASSPTRIAPSAAGLRADPKTSTPSWPLLVAESIWCLGFILVVAPAAFGAIQLFGLRRRSVPAPDSIEGLARRVGVELGVAVPPTVRIAPQIGSPLVFGVRQAQILLPESCLELSPDELEMVLRHELAHVVRRDPILAIVPHLATGIFWFFPIVHLAAREWAIQREIACDGVAYRESETVLAQYRRLLLRFVEADRTRMPGTVLGATSDYRSLHRRLTATPAKPAGTGSIRRLAGLAAILPIVALATPVTLDTGTSGGLLENADFESGTGAPDGWATGERLDGVKYVWDAQVAHSGKHSLSIFKTADRYFPIAQWSQTIPYNGHAGSVEFSGWLKADHAFKSVLDVQFATDDGVATHQWVHYCGEKEPGQGPETHGWRRVGGIAKIPAGTTHIVLAFQDYGPGHVWLDDVSARFLPVKP